MKNRSRPSSATTVSGCYGTNTDYNAETVAHVYESLWVVEDIFRTTKSILETRPIYHKCDETIRGHVFCSFLALLLKQELESRMKRADLEWEWKEVIRGLDTLQQVEANFQGRRFLFRSQLTAHASQAVRATAVAIPPTLRELQ
jgi:transposase